MLSCKSFLSFSAQTFWLVSMFLLYENGKTCIHIYKIAKITFLKITHIWLNKFHCIILCIYQYFLTRSKKNKYDFFMCRPIISYKKTSLDKKASFLSNICNILKTWNFNQTKMSTFEVSYDTCVYIYVKPVGARLT